MAGIGRMRRRRTRTYRDRIEAGGAVALALERLRGKPNLLILGLARGGVPVAAEVAGALQAPLDAFVVRKLGVPQWTELAMGALATGGVVVLNDDLISRLHVSAEQLQHAIDRESVELARRETAYRGDRSPLDPSGKIVVLVDDGIATGASMRAACTAVRAAGASQVVAAVPVGPPDLADLAGAADELVCVTQPADFSAVGQVYGDFTQVCDAEVRRLLADAPTR